MKTRVFRRTVRLLWLLLSIVSRKRCWLRPRGNPGVVLAVSHHRRNRVSLSGLPFGSRNLTSAASFSMTSENLIADVDFLSVTIMDSRSSSSLRSFNRGLAAGMGDFNSSLSCSSRCSPRPTPPLSGDLLRSSSALGSGARQS